MSDKDKGFASMDKDKVKEIAAKGGRASHGGHSDSNDDQRKGSHSSSTDKSHSSSSKDSHSTSSTTKK